MDNSENPRKLRDELEFAKYQIPRNIESRIQERQRLSRLKDSQKQTKSQKPKSFVDLDDDRQLRLKNGFESGVDLNVSLDMLDTSELMGYYKTVVAKS